MINISDLGELTVEYKYKSSFENRPQITNNNEAFNVIKQVIDIKRIGLQEQFIVIYLNASNKVIGTMNQFSGTQTCTVVDFRIIVGAAIQLMASGIIIAHNHPSSSTFPSVPDIKLTVQLKKALELMGICLIDHIIISPEGDDYTSLTNEGIINSELTSSTEAH